jgi:tryptophanyl-tRNA synthetase
MRKGRILSGMRPTGRLHLGNLLGALSNWVKLQDDYECFFAVVDWHALTTGYEDTSSIRENVREVVKDYLAAGIDPERSTVFLQSGVKEHAELHLLLSMITPLGWLERCPTYKDQLQQLAGRDITTYGFLGYPVLMASDILVYRADTVPVGEDQLPHLELSREIARRFNFLYAPVFPEPKALLNEVPTLVGTDGRKMSKSYGNTIQIASTEEEVRKSVQSMVTDPARIRKSDPGHPEVCTVYSYYKALAPQLAEVRDTECRNAGIGCVACKKQLADVVVEYLSPMWERRNAVEKDPGMVDALLEAGTSQARQVASATMEQVREAMKI